MLTIKETAKRYKVPMKDIYIKIGISKTAMSYYANGHRNPSLSTLQEIADVIGCDIIELFEPSSNYAQVYKNDKWEGVSRIKIG